MTSTASHNAINPASLVTEVPVVAGPNTASMIVELTDIAINPALAGMRTDRDSKHYKDSVKRLAETIKAEGQKNPLQIRPNTLGGDELYELVAGHRRVDALKMLKRTEAKAELDDYSDEQAKRWARHENMAREDFSAMEKALMIQEMRAEGKDTKTIANELVSDVPTVTQLEKLLALDRGVQKKVEDETLTVTGAIELGSKKVDPAKRKEVLAKAEEKAVAETQKIVDAEVKKQVAKIKRELAKPAPKKEKVVAAKNKIIAVKKKKVKVQQKHVRAAIRETGASSADRAPNRTEIIERFERLSESKNLNQAVRDFLVMSALWMRGKMKDGAFLTRGVEYMDSIIRNDAKGLHAPYIKELASAAMIEGAKAQAKAERMAKIQVAEKLAKDRKTRANLKKIDKKAAKAKAKSVKPVKSKSKSKGSTKGKAKAKGNRAK